MYVNLDDFNFLPYLSIELLERILRFKRNKKENFILFLDEVQNVPAFEKWLKTHYDRNAKIKFVISGSNLSLLDGKLISLLTGRNLTHEIFPFSFKEFKILKQESNIDEYLEFGGFPEVVLAENKDLKCRILRDYVQDIITKDILHRKKVRNQRELLFFVHFILNSPGIKLSINSLAKQTKLSKDAISKYIEYMIDAYLIIDVPYFSYSAKAKLNNSNRPKYYALDNGLYRVNVTRSQKGNQVENLIAITLRRKHSNIFYWTDQTCEVDFIVDNESFNVTTSKDCLPREVEGLNQLKRKIKHVKKFTLLNPEKKEKEKHVKYLPYEEFLAK